MQLNIRDRFYIPAIFPTKGTFAEYSLKREIIKKIAITEEDKKKYSIEENLESGQVTWNKEMDLKEPLIVEFTTGEIEYLKKSCESLSESLCPDDFWSTVEKVYNEIG